MCAVIGVDLSGTEQDDGTVCQDHDTAPMEEAMMGKIPNH